MVDEEDEIIGGDVTRDGLVNSADTDIVGDTNGDGIVDENDTGLVGDANGESFFFLCVCLRLLCIGPILVQQITRVAERGRPAGGEDVLGLPGNGDDLFLSSATPHSHCARL